MQIFEATVLCCGILLFGTAAISQERGPSKADGQWVTFGENVRSLHLPVGSKRVWIYPAFEDYLYMVIDICEALELSDEDCFVLPMNGEVGAAIATVHEGHEIIVYDRRLHNQTFFDPMVVIAHELGHHYCRHLYQESSSDLEREADRFAGAAMRKTGMSLEILMASTASFPSLPGIVHPGRQTRMQDLTAGWLQPELGISCRE